MNCNICGTMCKFSVFRRTVDINGITVWRKQNYKRRKYKSTNAPIQIRVQVQVKIHHNQHNMHNQQYNIKNAPLAHTTPILTLRSTITITITTKTTKTKTTTTTAAVAVNYKHATHRVIAVVRKHFNSRRLLHPHCHLSCRLPILQAYMYYITQALFHNS